MGCTVCRSPRVADVDADVAAGKTRPSIAAAYGLSIHALHRHVKGGHGIAVGGASPSRSVKGATALDRARAVVEAMEKIDATKLGAHAQSMHAAEYRRALELMAKLEAAATARSGATEGEWERKYREAKEHVQLVARVLRGFPEAERAVADAYRARRSAGGGA